MGEEDTTGSTDPVKVGERSKRTETVQRQFDEEGKLTAETVTIHRVYLSDDLPFPGDGYL